MGKLRKAFRVLALGGAPLRALIRYRVAASVEHRGVLHGLGFRTVVDIGANRGQFALIARFLYPGASIVSFEPLADAAGLFRRVFAEDHKVRLEKCAIGATSQRRVIHISARDDSSSLLSIGEGQLRNFPGTEEAGSEVVDVRRLDKVLRPEEISPSALLKLDVQGFELEALRGCEELLRCFSWVYCECSFVPLYEGQAMADQVVVWLHRRNFRLRGVHNMTHDKMGGSLQADFLFERQQNNPLAP